MSAAKKGRPATPSQLANLALGRRKAEVIFPNRIT